MSSRSVRVAVVVDAGGLPCYPRLDECSLDVVAAVRTIEDLLGAPSHEHEAAIVACTSHQLTDPRFRARLGRLSRSVPTVLVAPRITRTVAMTAARSRTLGLVVRSADPDELSRTVRAVIRGHIAYPQQALGALLRLLPPLTDHVTATDSRATASAPVPRVAS